MREGEPEAAVGDPAAERLAPADVPPGAMPTGGQLLDQLPVGVLVYDAQKRLVSVNRTYYRIMDLPDGTFGPGLALEDQVRILAYRGTFGPGDPEAQVEEVTRLDVSEPQRLRRRRRDGRSFEASYVPLREGGHMVCVADTTHLSALREEAALAAARADQALSGARAGIAAFGPDRCLVLANRRFMELMGLPAASAAPGTPFADIVEAFHLRTDQGAGDVDAFLSTQLALDRNRQSVTRRLQGSGLALDIASDPLADGSWVLTVSDVTATVRAEDESRRNAAQLDGVLRRIPQGVSVIGPDRRVAMFNRAYSDIMRGLPIAVGDLLDDVVRRWAEQGEFGPGDIDTLVAQELAVDRTLPQVRRRRRPNGTTIDIRTAPLPDGGYTTVLSDVTSLVQAEAEASRRAAELDAMLGSIRHGIVLWGPDRRVVAFNRIAEEVQELPPGLLVIGRSVDDMMAQIEATGAYGTPEQAAAYKQRILARDPTKQHRRQRVLPSGRVLDIVADPTPDGGWVATYTDVSDLRVAEDELRRAKAAAEAANIAKSRFLATMSHELRTPLNAVIGFSDSLLRSAQDGAANPDRVVEYAEAINQSGRQLLALIDTILDVARLEAGRFDLSSDRVDLSHLVRACVRQADASAAAAEVALTVELPMGLPLVRGDERRLRQVLSQVLSNAIKFTGASGSVSVGAGWDEAPQPGRKDAERDLLLRVRDSGIGIREEDLERVFEPFTQLDSSLSRRFQGTGLGLYIGRALMRAHGGDLELSSRLGEGTTATLRFPAGRLLPPPLTVPTSRFSGIS